MGIRKIVVAAALLAAVTTTAGVAHAGFKSFYAATVVKNADGSGRAYGSMGTARNSANNVEYVICYTQGWATGTAHGTCLVRNSASEVAMCSATSDSQLNAIRSASTDSYVYFDFDTTGACTYLYVANGSSHEPKVP